MAAPTPLNDEDLRWLLVRTAASLSRLWARLLRVQAPVGSTRPLVSQHIQPREPWLDVLPENVAMSGVIQAVLLAQGLLLDAAVSPEVPDRRRLCLIVQHVQCGATMWSKNTLRFAEQVGVTLHATVIGETGGSSMHQELFRLDGTYAQAIARLTEEATGNLRPLTTTE